MKINNFFLVFIFLIAICCQEKSQEKVIQILYSNDVYLDSLYGSSNIYLGITEDLFEKEFSNDINGPYNESDTDDLEDDQNDTSAIEYIMDRKTKYRNDSIYIKCEYNFKNNKLSSVSFAYEYEVLNTQLNTDSLYPQKINDYFKLNFLNNVNKQGIKYLIKKERVEYFFILRINKLKNAVNFKYTIKAFSPSGSNI